MPFVMFHELCPEVAKAETRSLTVPLGSEVGVPAGDYGFLEMFCDEPGCDCRRVMFYVMSLARKDVEAVIAWGWEDRDFYARWYGMDDLEMVKELKGPVLNLGSPQTRYSGAVLRLAEKFLLTEPVYVERIKRHYAMFRERIGGQADGRARGRTASGPKGARDASKRLKARRKQARKRRGPGGGS